MSKPKFRPLIPKRYQRSCFGGYVQKDDSPSSMRMEVGKQQVDGSVIVRLTPQDAVTGDDFCEAIRAMGGTPISLNTGGDGIINPHEE